MKFDTEFRKQTTTQLQVNTIRQHSTHTHTQNQGKFDIILTRWETIFKTNQKQKDFTNSSETADL